MNRDRVARRPHRAIVAALLGAVLVPVGAWAARQDAPVAVAARDRDLAAVRALLRKGHDVNSAEGDGMTALHWAALNDDPDTARTLLYAGANVRATTRNGAYTPLLVAARTGNAAAMAVLLEAGAEVDARTSNGSTALMLAAAAGRADAVELLADHGAALDAREGARGQAALHFAAASNRVEVIDALVRRGADPDAATDVVDTEAIEKEMSDARRMRARIAAAVRQARAPQSAAGAEGPRARGAAEAAAPRPGTEPEAKEGAEREAEAEGVAAAAESEEAGRAPPPEPDPELGTSPLPEARDAASAAAATAAESEQQEVDPDEDPELGQAPGGAATEKPADEAERAPERPRRMSFGTMVGPQGAMTPLHYAARQGHVESVQALLELGAELDVASADATTPLLVAVINGHFDLAMYLLEQGADVNATTAAGVTPLYATLNVRWAPKTLYPQPRAYEQQATTHVELMEALLARGADPNTRLEYKVWYSGYNFDLSGVDERGATPFWRAAYGSDVPAMRLLVAYGADPAVRTRKPPGRPRTGDVTREVEDVSGLAEVPVGGPAVAPIHAATGVGYGEGFAANSHRNAPGGWMPALTYLVEELGADVNAVDHEGNTPLHLAAARGDNEMILYLVSKGADVTAVNREGNTVADMANGPVQRIQPFPETVALLEKLGSKNNDRCVSC